MPTPFESAQLNLRLFDLRREPVLREARAWFLNDFNPESMAELETVVMGARDADAILERRRNAIRTAANARRAAPVRSMT